MSTGIGSDASAFRCMTMPIGFCSLTALCAAWIARGRLSETGNTMVGKRTMPRTGTMMSASGGSGGVGAAPEVACGAVAASASAIARLRLLQRDQEAAVGGGSMNGVVAARRKGNAALEAALRQLKAVDDRGLHLGRIGANPRNDQLPAVDQRLDLAGVDAGQGDEHEHGAVGLEDIRRRLPCDAGSRAGRPEELLVHALRASQRLEGFGPHPIAREIRLHRFT